MDASGLPDFTSFKIFTEAMIRRPIENCEQGVKIGGQLIKAVRFADDQSMVADSEKGLQEILDHLNAAVEDFGMRINVKKTKVMRFNRNGEGDAMIKLNSKNLEQVRTFKYQGSMFSNNGYCSVEMTRSHIMLAKISFNSKHELPTKNLDIKLRKTIIKTLVWSVLLYASE